jgi:hypothetical protein
MFSFFYSVIFLGFHMEAKFGPPRKDKKQLTTVEKKFFRRTAEYNLLTQKK